MTDGIPLRNIWLLFLYAADMVRFREQLESEVEEARDLPDLLARLLTQVVEERLKRNLSRGYRPRSQTLSRVRGRIDMLQTTSRRLIERGAVACRYEDHTMDTPRNRLVRAALERLGARVENTLIAHRCRQLAGDFARMGVVATRPPRSELVTEQIGRNESADRIMVSLARMVFDVVIPAEDAGRMTTGVPEVTSQLVRKLFERAIGTALQLELSPEGWSVKPGRRLSWPTTFRSAGMAEILPGMQTDIELDHLETGRRIVIDTKFTAILSRSNYRDGILKSGYLYQLYTYLRTQERMDDPRSLSAEGMLLHPQTGGAIDEVMTVQGHPMRFKTIDLTAPPGDFERALRALL